MAYIGQSLVEGTRRVYNYTATSGQTTFNAVYQVGVVDVYKNGLLLTPSSYTSSNGQQIVLSSGASAGDTIAIHAHNTFSVTDTVPATGGAFSGAVTVQGAFTSLGIDDNADATAITIDSSERVGIGVTAPATTVHMKAASANLRIEDSDTSAYGQLGVDNAGSVYLQADNANAQSSTNMYFSLDNSEKMRISSNGNVGVGVAGVRKLHVGGTGSGQGELHLTNATTGHTQTDGSTFTTSGSDLLILQRENANIRISTNGSERMRIDGSGRVGIGGTPNTNWRDDIANQEVLMLGTEATLFSDGGVTTELWNNAYVDNSDVFKNISTRGASRYSQYQGAHKWYTAASASAGSTITSEIQTTPKMTLDVSGNVHITDNANGPDAALHIEKTTPQIRLQLNGNSGYNTIQSTGSNELIFGRSGTEQLRIDSAGRVGIGITPAAVSDSTGTDSLQLGGSFLVHFDEDGAGTTSLSNNVYWNGSNNKAFFTGGSSQYYQDGGTHVWRSAASVSAGANASLTERMRIEPSAGHVYIGHSSGLNFGAGTTAGITFDPNGALVASRSGDGPLYLQRSSSDGGIAFFYRNTSLVGSISVASSGTTYNTTSDQRLKTDIQPITDGTEKLMTMNPVTHKWKADPHTGETVHGFIAQEMQDIAPEAVTGDPDGEAMMSMDYGRITPILVAALQDAHKKIDALETRLASMEAK